jgi:oligopeptide/dipeptide ABC transporter ATP-binding protein
LHPYTSLLISAIPVLSADGKRARLALEGEPSSPVDPDPGVCCFYGRCPRGQQRCTEVMPSLIRIAPGHDAACHFAQAPV